MTVVTEDEPEISFGGEDDLPSPSAPSVTASIIPENRPSLDAMPTATATAAVIQAARVPSFVSRPLADGRTGNIERTTNSTDGSLSVKVTSTTYQPNGYREMTTEYFHIPSHMTNTVSMAMDVAGEPPSSVYRTNIQHQILPPSSGAVISPTPASAYAIPTPGQSRANDIAHQLASSTEGANSAPTPTPAESVNTVCRNVFGVIMPILVIGIIGAGIGVAAHGSSDSSQTSNTYSWPTPYPSPRPSEYVYPYCNGKRTGGTPGWTDRWGDGCEWFENLDYCSNGAKENCCYCIVDSDRATPTPYPTPKPTSSKKSLRSRS